MDNSSEAWNQPMLGLDDKFPDVLLVMCVGEKAPVEYSLAILGKAKGLACFTNLHKMEDYLKLGDFSKYEARWVTFDDARKIAKTIQDAESLVLCDDLKNTKRHYIN